MARMIDQILDFARHSRAVWGFELQLESGESASDQRAIAGVGT